MEMITSLAQYITGILHKNDIIDGKKLDIYIYGFEIIVSGVISVFIGVTLGIIFSQVLESIIFLIAFRQSVIPSLILISHIRLVHIRIIHRTYFGLQVV